MQESIRGHPQRALVYSSLSIRERRQRLLKETRRLIAEKGLQGFTVRELCSRASVAQRTLYNAFHDKDRLIGLAIREVYDEVRQRVRYKTDDLTLAGLLDRAIVLNRGNLHSRNYAQAVAAIYFSPTTSRDLWNILQEMAVGNTSRWLHAVRLRGELHDWVKIDELTNNMANMEYGIIQNWAAGHIRDADYLRVFAEAILLAALAATRGATHAEAAHFLDDIHKTGKLPVFENPVFSTPDRRS